MTKALFLKGLDTIVQIEATTALGKVSSIALKCPWHDKGQLISKCPFHCGCKEIILRKIFSYFDSPLFPFVMLECALMCINTDYILGIHMTENALARVQRLHKLIDLWDLKPVNFETQSSLL